MEAGLLETLVQSAGREGLDLSRWALAAGRVAPSVLIVPAFGLRAVPGPVRVVLALALALALVPTVSGVGEEVPWALRLVLEFLRGLPVAISAAVVLWTATMVGGLTDNLAGSRHGAGVPAVEGGSTPSGTLLSLGTSVVFLGSGGPARVVEALSVSELGTAAWWATAAALNGGIQLAVALAAPLVVASVVLEVGSALVARAASPAWLMPLLSPLKALAVLLVFALSFEALLEQLARLAASRP